jgi:Response regulator containing CheY-like receiver, AAA-type ATPase, and DNA-binding domains
MSQTVTHKKAMLQALEKTLGIVTDAATMAGIERRTHYRWYNEDAEYKKAVDAIGDLVLDMAESSLHRQVKADNIAATIFYLKTKGKKRGYIEKQEIGFTDNEGKDIQIIFKNSGDEPVKE